MATKIDDLEAVRLIVEALKDFDGGDQERIIRWAREKVGLPAGSPLIPPQGGGPPSGGEIGRLPAGEQPQSEDIRSFITLKNPQSDTHLAAAVAYYYRFKAPADQQKENINGDDLQNACRMADRGRLKNPGQTLINAHHTGLLDNVGRGSYSINAVGENLVAMALPDSGGNRKSTKAKAKKARKKVRKKSRSGKSRPQG